MMELQRTLLWIHHAVLRGAYHSAIRELRYSLKSMVQAAAIDQELREKSMAEKFARIVELEGRTKVRDSFKAAGAESLYALYADRSRYSHPSSQELAPALLEGNVDSRFVFTFDEGLFEVTRKLTEGTLDALLFLAVVNHPEAMQDFARKPMVLESLIALEQVKTHAQLTWPLR